MSVRVIKEKEPLCLADVSFGAVFEVVSNGEYYMKIDPGTEGFNVVNIKNGALDWFSPKEPIKVYDAVVNLSAMI